MDEGVPDLRDDEVLWRRVAPELIQPDGTPQSSAFRNEELSVHRSELTTREAVLELHPDHQVWSFTVAEAVGLGFMVRAAPPPREHAIVLGISNSRQARKLRNLARLTK